MVSINVFRQLSMSSSFSANVYWQVWLNVEILLQVSFDFLLQL